MTLNDPTITTTKKSEPATPPTLAPAKAHRIEIWRHEVSEHHHHHHHTHSTSGKQPIDKRRPRPRGGTAFLATLFKSSRGSDAVVRIHDSEVMVGGGGEEVGMGKAVERLERTAMYDGGEVQAEAGAYREGRDEAANNVAFADATLSSSSSSKRGMMGGGRGLDARWERLERAARLLGRVDGGREGKG